MGLTQRQAPSRFTRDEAAACIARLQGNELGGASRRRCPSGEASFSRGVERKLRPDPLTVADLDLPAPTGELGAIPEGHVLVTRAALALSWSVLPSVPEPTVT